MNKILRQGAYTLAETLLTLAIIGVIAALTIPTLRSNAEEKKFVSLTQKAFNTISEATARVENKHGNSEFWVTNNLSAWYKEVMNIDIGAKADNSIESSDIAGGGPYRLWNADTLISADGMYWNFSTNANSPDFVVDVNGPQSPNIIGVDIHAFYLSDEGVVPQGAAGSLNDSEPWKICCTYYTIQKNKMPWLETPMNECPDI